MIIMPQRDITIGQWSGTGYIDMNPSTGTAGYIISGGISSQVSVCGSSTIDVWPIDLGCEPYDYLFGEITPEGFSDGEVLCAGNYYIGYEVELDYDCEQVDGSIENETFSARYSLPLTTLETVETYGPGTYTISIPEADVDPVSFTLVYVEFTEDEVATRWQTGGTFDAKNLLSTDSTADSSLLNWTISPNTAGATIDSNGVVSLGTAGGSLTVTASAGGGSCRDSFTLTHIAVKSLLPDIGDEVDDQDGNPNTRTFVVCASDNPGDVVTVTAEPDPPVAEDDLPSYWSLTGGTGSGKLSRTIDRTTPGIYIVKATTGGSVKTTTVIIFKIQVTNIKFNYDTNSSTHDAINLRQNLFTPYDISNGEWIQGVQNLPVCYAANRTVNIQVRLTLEPAIDADADIWAGSTGTNGSLGNIAETHVTFSKGVSSPEYVTSQVSGRTPANIQRTTTDTWQWQMEHFKSSASAPCNLNSSGPHTIYTLLSEPAPPWDNTAGSMQNGWTLVLDMACAWASGAVDESNTVAKITLSAYSEFGKTHAYDAIQTHSPGNLCQLTAILYDNVVDCQDMSAVVQLFTRIVGGAGVQFLRVNGPFNYNPVLPIGESAWSEGVWNFHQFAWDYGAVYDACVQLNQSAPYSPAHDDLNGNYKANLCDGGTWNPLAPDTITILY
jgi:hypothetical protein